MNFFSNLFKDKPKIIPTHFSGKFNFEIINSKEIEKVIYEITIIPENGKNNFIETITRNKRILFSSKKKILFNESTQSEIKNYFIPKNLPALSSINEPDFLTINLLRGFFQRIFWVSSNKSRQVDVSPEAVIPDNTGANISSGTSTNRATSAYTGYEGGGQAHNNLQPYQVVNYIIKT